MREDWLKLELGKICEVNMGQSPPSSTYNREGIGIPFFQGKAEFTSLHPIIEKWCTAPKKTARQGDILISVRAPVGSTNIANTDCAIGRGLAAITYPFGNKYLWYYLKHIEQKLDAQGTGTTFKAISGSILKSQSFPLAPLPEQRAIVAKIEQLFSELDNGIANLKDAKDKLEIYRQAVLKKAFEGELTKEWREIYYTVLPKQKTTDIPLGWRKVKSGDVMESIDNGYTPQKEYLFPGSGEIPFIKVYNLCFDGSLNFTVNPTFIPNFIHEKKLKRSICVPGDVLINIVGPPLGKVSIVPKLFPEWNINQAIVRLRPNELIQSKFLSYFMQNLVTIHWLEGTSKATAGQFNVKVTTCREIPMLLPPIEEQTQIVNEIESRLSVCDSILANIEEGLEKSEALRQSILKQAFEGRLLSEEELEACRKEPDWEPAEALLARIQNEKAAKT